MTAPITSDSDRKKFAGFHRRADQLERRPANTAAGGAATGAVQIHLDPPDPGASLSAGDGKREFMIPSDMDGYTLAGVAAYVVTVSSSGGIEIQIRNATTTHDMLTTKINIDVSEHLSYDAVTQPLINSTYAAVAAGDLIAIDCDSAGTSTKGLGIVLDFSPP